MRDSMAQSSMDGTPRLPAGHHHRGSPWLASDDEFDTLYATAWRQLSKKHWTPVEVGRLAAHWLTEDPDIAQVLDVGSGVGKLCITGALATGRTFIGIEHRPHLVRAAAAAAHAAGVSSHVRFVCDRLSLEVLGEFRSIYLFNPFAENTFAEACRIDCTVESSLWRYEEDIALVQEGLRRAPLGQRVVTYHGFGGELPRGYIEEHCEGVGTDVLELWVKHRAP